MSLKKIITDSVTYNHWAHKKYGDWLSQKPDELLNKEVPSSFNTIRKTLQHILQTQVYWGNSITEKEGSVKVPYQTNKLFEGLLKNSEKLVDYVTALSEEELQKKVKIESQWFSCNFSKYEYIQHTVMHSTYHRGQIVTIGRNIGITDAPMTDYNFWNINKEQITQ